MTTNAAPGPVQTYVSALAATGQIEAPFGAVAFTLLTTLLRLHELVRPTTEFTGSQLIVANPSPPRGQCHDRDIPVPVMTARLLSDSGPGRLSSCLGLDGPSLPRLADQLRLALLDHDDLAAMATPELLWVGAVHALTAAANGRRQRSSVLAYAGIRPQCAGAAPGPRAASVGKTDLAGVTALIDHLALEAGFGLQNEAIIADAS